MNNRIGIVEYKGCMLVVVLLFFSLFFTFGAFPDQKTLPPSHSLYSFQNQSSLKANPDWKRFKILIWPYQTDVINDYDLYQQMGIGGFQIDRGAGKQHLVDFSISREYPYYVGHVAGKGTLYLTGGDAKAVTGKSGLINRPHSLASRDTVEKMKSLLKANIGITKNGPVLAYAFDDEISLGKFTNPCDLDVYPDSLAWFRQWLKNAYATIDQLNEQWGTRFEGFDTVYPKGYEETSKTLDARRLAKWNLSAWIDFRHFMDIQFASVLSELTGYANTLDPGTPAGFVGGQAPGPWGGYDYALLTRAVQWMEAYDIHGTNEILRSFWNADRNPRMQTFFSTRNPKADSWFLWYYLLHGNQGVIAWPEGWFIEGSHRRIAPHIRQLTPAFRQVQSEVSSVIVDPDTHFDPDPIGIYYSHPSIQAGWAMDALAHGRTWPNRYSSIDNDNQSQGILRQVWCKTLEDLGFQYDFISYLDVRQRRVDINKRFKVIVLPKTVCLSNMEVQALRDFVENGGTLVADYLCGMMDEHGKARPAGALDSLFGIRRSDRDGYFDGKGLYEIDAEKYKKPFLNRFTHFKGAGRHNGIVIVEKGTYADDKGSTKSDAGSTFPKTPDAIIENSPGKGRTAYLNLAPLEYWSHAKRLSDYGRNWRDIVASILEKSGLTPRVSIAFDGKAGHMPEALFWKNKDRLFMGIVINPSEKDNLKDTRDASGINGDETDITLRFNHAVTATNMRTGRHFPAGVSFTDRFKPWEGNLYEIKKVE